MSMFARSLLGTTVCAALACTTHGGAQSEEDTTEEPQSSDLTLADSPPPIEQGALGCDGVFHPMTLRDPLWRRVDLEASPLAECLDASVHAGTELYDDCVAKEWDLIGCDIPWGSAFCDAGHWTIVCQDDTDCPETTRCTWGHGTGALPTNVQGYGWCAKSCEATGTASDCIRCDMECDSATLVCMMRPSEKVEGSSELRRRAVSESAEPTGIENGSAVSWAKSVFASIVSQRAEATRPSPPARAGYHRHWRRARGD